MDDKSKDVETGDIMPLPTGFGLSFNEKAVRLRFIRKVYGLLMSQLLITTSIICVFCFTPAIKRFYCSTTFTDTVDDIDIVDGAPQCRNASRNGSIMYMVTFGVFITTYIVLVCSSNVRRKSPWNLIALFVFTLAKSLLVANIGKKDVFLILRIISKYVSILFPALFHNVYWVMMAAGITALLCLGLTLFACQTKWDVTGWVIYIFAASWIMVIIAILMIVFFVKSYPILHVVYSGLVAVLFSVYLIVRTQQIVGSKKVSISPEEHIFAATQLYVSVANIFLGILGLGRR